MKQQKILTLITIVLLTLFLTGCGPTLEEKIAEVQESNTITTADVVELLELEGLTVEPQRAGVTIHESWKGVNVYKVNGENLLFLINFDGAPWDVDNKLYELRLSNSMEWLYEEHQKEYQSEQIQSAIKMLKTADGLYYSSQTWSYKNIIAVYVPFIVGAEKGIWDEELEKALDIAGETKGIVKQVFLEDLNNMQTSEYTSDGQYFTAKVISYFSEVPYEYDDRLMYIYSEDSKCTIFLNEDIAKQYQGQNFEICFKGPLEGPAASSGSRGLGGTIDNTMSFTLSSSSENTGYGKEPYTGPIQYEVTVTIGDDITETLIVGREGAEAGE